MILILATLGFTSVIGQVVLMRELVSTLYGNELVYGLILAWWLLWEAAGAWGLGRWTERHRWGARALALTITLAALALPAQIALTRSIRDLIRVTPGTFMPLEQMLWVIGLILAPYCLAHGLGFSLGARLMKGDHAVAGRAYAYESIGAAIGGALFSFVLINHLDPFQATLLVAVFTLVAGLNYALHTRRPQDRRVGPGATNVVFASARRRSFLTIVALVAGIILVLPLGARLHQWTLGRQWPRLVYAKDSRYGRLTITALGGQRAFFENGLLAFETESTFPEQVVHLPLLAHPDPRRVLLIGGGVAGDLVELFKHDITKVTYLELDPLMIKAARMYLPPEQATVLDDPRLTLIFQDGRHYTKRSQERFDIIILDLPEPSTGQLNRFYTLEFFQEVNAVLAEGGLFSLGLPSAENYWTRELARRNASVYRTLRQVFPTVLVTPGDQNFYLAATSDDLPSAGMLGERLGQRGIATRWVTREYIEFLLEGDRFRTVQADLEGAENVKLNRDLTPICYFYDLALWLSRFGGGLRGIFETTSLLRLSWLVPPLILALVTLWGRRQAIGLALVAGTGFAGMTLQIVLLLAFQALHGYVFYKVSILVTAFMAGLALGAGAMTRWRSTTSALWLTIVQSGLVLYALVLAVVSPAGLPAPGVAFPLLAAAAGALVGAIFPLAAILSDTTNQTARIAGLLYGADLLGGCIGAIVASTILVPVLGVVQTCVAVALVGAAGALLCLSLPLSNLS